MSATAEQPLIQVSRKQAYAGRPDDGEDPIVVVGNGPVGMRFAAECLNRIEDHSVVIYGDETHLAYNRVRLSSWLAGEVSDQDLEEALRRPFGAQVEERIGYRVVSINRKARTITDSSGRQQAYSHLVLATGSRPFVPPIPGIDIEGVFTLRNKDDATRLMARRIRSRRCVVVGAGLLGLETARGMQPNNTEVTIVDHADRVMARQLDIDASSMLEKEVKGLGFNVLLGSGIAAICGSPRVTGVRLHSGVFIECDTVVVATGIQPSIELAVDAGLAYGRGIKVDDHLCTSDPAIHAIGECAEHNNEVYGLVAPGFEQASSLVGHLAGDAGRYRGSTSAARLKVVGTPVFSIGDVGDTAHPLQGREHVYRDNSKGIYRKLVVRRHRVIGAIGIGPWTETVRLQSVIAQAQRAMPWELLRFRRSGQLWVEDTADVVSWPSTTTVCQCNNVTRGRLGEAIALGAITPEALGQATGAGTTCGSCQVLLRQLVGSNGARKPNPLARPLTAAALVALVGLVLFIALQAIPYARSVADTRILGIEFGNTLDVLWRDGFIKQVSGFTILGVALLASLISLRKRTSLINRLGAYVGWRLVHSVLGLVTIAALLTHTGMRLGHGLNLWLMTCFLALLVAGAAASLSVGIEHKLGKGVARFVRRQSVLWHIVFLWPLPVLLGFHILKGYWY